MYPHPSQQLGVRGLEFIGTAASSGGASYTISKPPGLAVGDLMIVLVSVDSTGITGGSGGWTQHTVTMGSTGWVQYVFWKLVTASDVASTLTMNNSGGVGGNTCQAYAYRGGGLASVALNATANGFTGTTLDFSQGAVGATCIGLFMATWDRDTAGGEAPPAGWATRRAGAGVATAMAADIFKGFTAGSATVTVTGFANTIPGEQVGILIEFRAT